MIRHDDMSRVTGRTVREKMSRLRFAEWKNRESKVPFKRGRDVCTAAHYGVISQQGETMRRHVVCLGQVTMKLRRNPKPRSSVWHIGFWVTERLCQTPRI